MFYDRKLSITVYILNFIQETSCHPHTHTINMHPSDDFIFDFIAEENGINWADIIVIIIFIIGSLHFYFRIKITSCNQYWFSIANIGSKLNNIFSD